MNTIIEFSHVVAGYDSKSILKELNLEIKEGDFWGIIGPNGGGKSTFIKTLIGLLKPLSGSIRYFRKGSSVSSLEVGYLPQYSMFDKKFPISVEEVVRSGLDRNCSSLLLRLNREQRQKVDSVLELVGMSNQRKEPIGELSGGQLQRTFLGRAIVSSPELLVLDEPQSYMDKNFETTLFDILDKLNEHATIIMVSHDLHSILEHAKTIVCVNRDIHTHPNKELPKDWISRHFQCDVEWLGYGLKHLSSSKISM